MKKKYFVSIMLLIALLTSIILYIKISNDKINLASRVKMISGVTIKTPVNYYVLKESEVIEFKKILLNFLNKGNYKINEPLDDIYSVMFRVTLEEEKLYIAYFKNEQKIAFPVYWFIKTKQRGNIGKEIYESKIKNVVLYIGDELDQFLNY